VGRELTKQFEQVHTLACEDLIDWLAADSARTRGEFALVLHPQVLTRSDDAGLALLTLLLAELPVKTAVRIAAEASGAPRNALYEAALRLRDQGAGAAAAAGDDSAQ
jgi:16S rRNA (cytidine1402-2'-O)-methyltransferase